MNRNTRLRAAILLVLAIVSVAAWSCSSNPVAEPPTETPSPSESSPAPSPTPEPPLAAPTEVPVEGLEGAQQALREGRFEEAATAFEDAAITAGDDIAVASAWLGAGVAWHGAEETDRAIEVLEQAAHVAPANTQVWRRVHYVLGLRLADAGEHERAMAVLEPIATANYADPLQPLVNTAYGRAAARGGELAEAEAAWLRALDSPFTTSSVRASILRDRARVAVSRGDAQGAVNIYGELVNVTGDPNDRFVLAEAALALGDRVTWETQLRAIILFSSGSRLAVSAIEDLEAAGLPVDPGDAGYVLYQQRRYAEAAELFREALADEALAPGDRAFRLYYLAASLEDDGLWADSVPVYDSVKEADPTSPFVHRAGYWAARAHESLEKRHRRVMRRLLRRDRRGSSPRNRRSERATPSFAQGTRKAGCWRGSVSRYRATRAPCIGRGGPNSKSATPKARASRSTRRLPPGRWTSTAWRLLASSELPATPNFRTCQLLNRPHPTGTPSRPGSPAALPLPLQQRPIRLPPTCWQWANLPPPSKF
jgi:tetratricopeptide (TPR) repeat protein